MCPSDKRIAVFLVDDHAVVRQGTREMLSGRPEFRVVGEAESGEGLADLLQATAPDVLLLDINLPGQNGLQLLEVLKLQFPALKIILFTAHGDLQYLRKALALKADGFLSKIINEDALACAILQACDGADAPVFSEDIAPLVAKLQSGETRFHLTAREQEILLHLAQGLTNQAIARQLCLSVKTVDTHVANLIKKTAVNNRTQLLAYAYENDLL